ncbi:hypothetical protein [Kitasatospora sp. DSM 101779]|uniref:hypothetical protein n=1 Tax=Kitasatospora sp. DSM 101779 TaxID=2853165 RepID=UPI0021DA93E6|nr:hypothetical protein [Kitasatospora sp. DSM 101779]MCU7826998.1 hypothetical protein [Kitasatospora sp. DSM 101779]
MKLRGVVCLAVAAAVVLGGLWVRGGAAAGFLPEASWEAWRSVDVEHWSVHVRVNAWANAAEADLHYGKAEDLTLRAYGATDTRTADVEPVRFTLRPDGTITVAHVTTDDGGTGSS